MTQSASFLIINFISLTGQAGLSRFGAKTVFLLNKFRHFLLQCFEEVVLFAAIYVRIIDT